MYKLRHFSTFFYYYFLIILFQIDKWQNVGRPLSTTNLKKITLHPLIYFIYKVYTKSRKSIVLLTIPLLELIRYYTL